jgi:hypothetical protein
VKERDARIGDLVGQLYDPDGQHLAKQNAKLRALVTALNEILAKTNTENRTLRRFARRRSGQRQAGT